MPDTEVRTRESALRDAPPSSPLSPTTPCANCGVALTGPYCSNCGQHVKDFHRSIWRFFTEFLDNLFCWDNKLFRTLAPLVQHPGLLTGDFMSGRRVRYVHPLRLFIFTSAVCLALLQYGHDNFMRIRFPAKGAEKSPVRAEAVPAEDASPTPLVPASPASSGADAGDTAEAKKARPGDDALGDSIRAAVAGKIAGVTKGAGPEDDDVDNGINQMLSKKIAKAGGSEKFGQMMTANFQQRLSWIAFALLPLFALGLYAVYWRRDNFYFEHLVFSLHYHTFLLVFWTIYTGSVAALSFLPLHSFWEALARLGLLWPPVYLFMALRRVYGDSPLRTGLKTVVLSSLHLLAILIGVAAVGAMAFLRTGE